MYTTLKSFSYLLAWVTDSYGVYGLCLLMIFMEDRYMCNNECYSLTLWIGLQIFWVGLNNNIHGITSAQY